MPWVVRWEVDGRRASRSFKTKALAERYRSELLVASRPRRALRPQHRRTAVVGAVARRRHGLRLGAPVDRRAMGGLAAPHPSIGDRSPQPLRAAAVTRCRRDPPDGIRADLATAARPARRRSDDDCDRGSAGGPARCELTASEPRNRSIAARPRPRAVSRWHRRPPAGTARSPGPASDEPSTSTSSPADPWPPPPAAAASASPTQARRVRRTPAADPARCAGRSTRSAPTSRASRTYQVMTAVAYYAGLRPSEVVMLRTSAPHAAGSGLGPHRCRRGRHRLQRARRAEDRPAFSSDPTRPRRDAHGLGRHPRHH